MELSTKEKRKQTNLQRYGVENVSQLNVVKQQKKQTTLINFGVPIPLQSNEIKEKQRQTNLQRYGVAHPWMCQEIRQKSELTWLKNYGVGNPQQSKNIQEKTKLTWLKNYGIAHPSQKHLSEFCLEKIHDYDWLYQEYIIKERTVSDIANELQIDISSLANHLRKFGLSIRLTGSYSFRCIEWIESIMKRENIFIQHGRNGGEYHIPGTKYKVDGYCKETNTIYEFYGDFWHGNPKIYKAEKKLLYQTMGEKYINTLQREKIIRDLGYNLITTWESDIYGEPQK